MLLVVFMLCLVTVSNAGDLTCSETTGMNATMVKSNDGVVGRYTAKVCMVMRPNVTKWMIDLLYKDNVRNCHRPSGHPGKIHSSFLATDIAKNLTELNCTNVCYTIRLEMIFSSCYTLKSFLYHNQQSYQPFDSYFNISNGYSIENFTSTTYAMMIAFENYTAISFFGNAPPSVYVVHLALKNSSDNGIEVTGNCSVAAVSRLDCSLWVDVGCYTVTVQHDAPWTAGFQNQSNIRYNFCRETAAGGGGARAGGGAALWAAWWCGGAALLAAAAALVWRARRRARKAPPDLLHSEARGARGSGAGDAGGAGAPQRVLLLYAREGELGQRLVNALRDLLQQYPNVQVQDLFSAESVRAASAAPHAWLAGALRSARVLLLQTPALAALYSPRHSPGSMSAPLLGHGAVYRTPHFGDTLLQYALRLLEDDACHPLAYRKYYLATLEECPTEALPQVVPFRRYALPAAAAALLGDVCGAGEGGAGATPAGGAALAALEAAAGALCRHVRAHPHYLTDELLLT